MSKKTLVGGFVAVVLLVVLLGSIVSVNMDDFTTSDEPQGLPTLPSDTNDDVDIWDGDELKENSLAYVIFENYGIVLIPLAILMFGAMVGGVVIAREEVENDDSN